MNFANKHKNLFAMLSALSKLFNFGTEEHHNAVATVPPAINDATDAELESSFAKSIESVSSPAWKRGASTKPISHLDDVRKNLFEIAF